MTSRLVRVARARNRSRYHTRAYQDHPHAARIRSYRDSIREVPRFIPLDRPFFFSNRVRSDAAISLFAISRVSLYAS